MSEESVYLDESLTTKVAGFNTLKKDKRLHMTSKFIENNNGIIKKNLGYIKVNKMSNGLLFGLLFNPEEIVIAEQFKTPTDYKFSEGTITVPKNLDLICKIILSKKFNQNGVFRVNSTKQRLRTAGSLLQDIIEDRVNEETGISLFNKNFDLIDCCELYKNLLRSFNTTIIPKCYIDIMIKIQNIEDPEAKLTCTKALYYTLPHNNRCILESHVYVCYAICKETSNMNQNVQQMDLDGISIVMLPNLVLDRNKDIEIEKVLVLVEFCKYLFHVFPEVCKSSN